MAACMITIDYVIHVAQIARSRASLITSFQPMTCDTEPISSREMGGVWERDYILRAVFNSIDMGTVKIMLHAVFKNEGSFVINKTYITTKNDCLF